ncbi:MAG: hypothetical protein Aurels2KO_39650 [Aureliella sp.]
MKAFEAVKPNVVVSRIDDAWHAIVFGRDNTNLGAANGSFLDTALNEANGV